MAEALFTKKNRVFNQYHSGACLYRLCQASCLSPLVINTDNGLWP